MRAWSKSGPKPQLTRQHFEAETIGRHIADDILKSISGMKNDDFQIRFKSNMFRGVQLITRQHWLR